MTLLLDDVDARLHHILREIQAGAEALDEILGRRALGVDAHDVVESLAPVRHDGHRQVEYLRDFLGAAGHVVFLARIIDARRYHALAIAAARKLELRDLLVEHLGLLDDAVRYAAVDGLERHRVDDVEQIALAIRDRVELLVPRQAIHVLVQAALGAYDGPQRHAGQIFAGGHAAASRVGGLGVFVAVVPPFGAIVDEAVLDGATLGAHVIAFVDGELGAVTRLVNTRNDVVVSGLGVGVGARTCVAAAVKSRANRVKHVP